MEETKKTKGTRAVDTAPVQIIDPAVAKREEDNARIRELNQAFKARLDKDEWVSFKPPVFFADLLGTVYAYTFNNENVVVRFDGTTQKFKKTVYDHLQDKLPRILNRHSHISKIDEL